MENNLFKTYYSDACLKLNKKINDFNGSIGDKNGIIDYNMNLFTDLNGNGKLVRGVLVNLGYSLIDDNNPDYSLDLALAFEIFQTAILVHDDIIDNANLRRGKETIHSSNYNKYYKLTGRKDLSKKMSESVALCVGDMGLYYANKVISTSYEDDENLGKVLNYFNDIVINTIKGELLDVVLPFLEQNKLNTANLEEDIMLIYELKTSYYTIIGPLCCGMILNGATKKQTDDITKFGYNVGVAFQIQDDILGIFSSNKYLEKNVGSDIEEFKQTVLYSYVKARKEYYTELIKYYGKKVGAKELEKVQDIFVKSGALKYANDLIEKLYDEALAVLDKIDWINNNKKEILRGFVEYLRDRKK